MFFHMFLLNSELFSANRRFRFLAKRFGFNHKKKIKIDLSAFFNSKQFVELFKTHLSEFDHNTELSFFLFFPTEILAESASKLTDKNKNKNPKNPKTKFDDLQLKISFEKN